MVKCVVLGCKNDSRKLNKRNSNISFHRFPKSRETIDAWVSAIKRPNWEPNIRTCICSIHFNASSIFETKKGLRKLAQDAIPELYLGNYPRKLSAKVLTALKTEVEIPNTQPVSVVKLEDSYPRLAPAPVVKLEEGTSRLAPAFIVKLEEGTPCPAPAPASVSIIEISPSPNDSFGNLKLKRQLKYIHEIAKRRRLRCNALYVQKNRLKKKIESLTAMLSELRKNPQRTNDLAVD